MRLDRHRVSIPVIGCRAVLATLSIPLLWLCMTANAEPLEGGSLTAIHAGVLLDVPGTPARQRQTILVEGERIREIRDGFLTAAQLSLTGETVTVVDLKDRFVLPGLIDAHVHLTLAHNDPRSEAELTGEEMLIDGIVNARLTLQAGFTTVRDVGARPHAWPVVVLRDAIAAGKIDGPRVLVAAASISATGGHGDLSGPADEPAGRRRSAGVCDGVAMCRRAVRRQFALGADLIKLNATGGGGERNGGKADPAAFFADELEAIVATAHSLGMKVAAHAHGTAGINAALAAGVDSIEHGSFLNGESIRLFNRAGAYLVPTLSVQERIAKEVGTAQGAARKRMRSFLDEHAANVGKAHSAGVRIALGTDAGVVPHGANARELQWYVKVGMTPSEALQAATVNAALLLGVAAGALEPGRYADLIALRGDPLADITALEAVSFVMKAGQIHKSR